jgi:asparagine synthetase B (glutamine-hydrolysing)
LFKQTTKFCINWITKKKYTCGINGLIINNLGFNKSEKKSLGAMNELNIKSPMMVDYFEPSFYTIGMAMRRLAIIDLSSGKQLIKMMTRVLQLFLMKKSIIISSSK